MKRIFTPPKFPKEIQELQKKERDAFLLPRLKIVKDSLQPGMKNLIGMKNLTGIRIAAQWIVGFWLLTCAALLAMDAFFAYCPRTALCIGEFLNRIGDWL